MKFQSRKSYPVQHPDGGTLYLYPLDAKESFDEIAALGKPELVLDPDGHVVYTQSGQPAMRPRQRAYDELVEFALRHVDRYEDVVDGDVVETDANGKEFNPPLAKEKFPALVRDYIGTHEEERPIYGDDGKPVMNENGTPKTETIRSGKALSLWIIEKCGELTRELREARRKNS